MEELPAFEKSSLSFKSTVMYGSRSLRKFLLCWIFLPLLCSTLGRKTSFHYEAPLDHAYPPLFWLVWFYPQSFCVFCLSSLFNVYLWLLQEIYSGYPYCGLIPKPPLPPRPTPHPQKHYLIKKKRTEANPLRLHRNQLSHKFWTLINERLMIRKIYSIFIK